MKTNIQNTQLSRRQFVRGLTATSVAAATGMQIPSVFAGSGHFPREEKISSRKAQETLTGNLFKLTISEHSVNITGTPKTATLVNGSLPAPTLVWREGEEVEIHVKNELDVDSSIHWHGIILPSNMDGVPGLSFDGIKPGETYVYKFKVQQTGSYWYHSHSGFQEQTGVYGAIVILPKKSEPVEADHDYVIQLSDWSDTAPETIYTNLKKMGGYYNFSQRTVGDFWQDVKQKGLTQAWSDRNMWNTMRMTDRDLSDVSGHTYTFLMNGLSPNAHWRALYQPGNKVRLRVINSSAMTFFDVRIPGLKMTVVAADGNLIQPVEVDEFRIGVAETYDVIVEPTDQQQAYAVFAQAIDRSGYAIGSLTTDKSVIATTPEMDPLPILSMTDMGMDHSNMEGMDHGSMNHSSHEMGGDMTSGDKHMSPAADHSQHSTHDMSGHSMPSHNMKSHDSSQMKHSEMPGMKHEQHSMEHSQHDMHSKSPNYEHALAMEKMEMGHDMSGVDHSKHSHTASDMAVNLDDVMIPMNMNPNLPQMKVASKDGPQIDMRATGAQYRLDDPGVGLRNNGRRVLTYADLKNLYPTRHEPKPTKELVLRLTGNMERYMWSINGIPYEDADPLRFDYGDRVRITFINDTMMNHPMHLHGVWSDLETGDENHIPRKHTIVVQPGAKISYRVTMDARGDWAYHCHML